MSFLSVSLIAANDHNILIFDHWVPICYDSLDLNERLYYTLLSEWNVWEVLGVFTYLISNFLK